MDSEKDATENLGSSRCSSSFGGLTMGYEIRQTQFNDPDRKSGQHTNGPANIFVREDDTSPWYFVEGVKSAYKVRKLIEEMGFLDFTRRHCARVCD